MEFHGLPGAELIEKGLCDLAAGRETVEAALVSVGAPRLRAAGIEVPHSPFALAEHRLWELLAAQGEDAAHGRYNALLRRLVSFERALECAAS
jgi:hypothetical protein